MEKFRKRRASTTANFSTASLPDIVFMLLFFFMVSTSMTGVSSKLKVQVPFSTQNNKLDKKVPVSYIYVGNARKDSVSNNTQKIMVQMNEHVGSMVDIEGFLKDERSFIDPDDLPEWTVILSFDKDIKMSLVNEVKRELRKANALKIIYSTENKKNGQKL